MWTQTDVPGLYVWTPLNHQQVIFGGILNADFSWWSVVAVFAVTFALTFLVLLGSDLLGDRSDASQVPPLLTDEERSPNTSVCVCECGEHYVFADDQETA